MHRATEIAALWLAALAVFMLLACGPGEGPGIADPCAFLSGDFKAPLDANTCSQDPGLCAQTLNTCLSTLDLLDADLWVLRTPNGAVPVSTIDTNDVRSLAAPQAETPMHGRYNAIFLNATAARAFNQQIVRDPQGHIDTATLPYGSVIVKQNFSSAEPPPSQYTTLEGEPWLTVMAKIEGYCNPTIGDSCVGGEWFYYLYRFGDFMQFNEVPVYGKPQAFCTDCHNPTAKADYLWSLFLYVRGRQQPYFADSAANLPASEGQLSPADLCAEGHLGIGPQAPPDVPVAPDQVAEDQRQAMFDCFSWRTFAALNWPTADGQRGVPDPQATLGDLGPARVWESYKETAEVFQPEIADWTLADQEWDDRQFIPEACQQTVQHLPQPERAKVMGMLSKTRAQQILNETHQAMGNQFNILVDQAGRLVQYEVRFNRDEYEYLKANGYADSGSYSFAGPKEGTVFFPTNVDGFTGLGATEIKAAWRELCVPDTSGKCATEDEATASRYYQQLGLIYTPETRQSEESCRLAKVGLVGLHIIRKTAHAPQWVWATFEHEDNVPPTGQAAQPGVDYLLYDKSCEGRTPSAEFCSLMRPGVIPSAPNQDRNCCPNAQLIINANPGKPNEDGTLQPPQGTELVKNQITRLVPVGPTAMNQRFRAALPEPWNRYFLVNTQRPSGSRQGPDQVQPGATRLIPCNVRDLLWSGEGSGASAFVRAGIPRPECYTMEPRQGSGELKLRNTTMETYQAAWNGAGSPEAEQLSSQSCFNCHGFSGVDFSFAWTDATEEIIPFPPAPPPSAGSATGR